MNNRGVYRGRKTVIHFIPAFGVPPVTRPDKQGFKKKPRCISFLDVCYFRQDLDLQPHVKRDRGFDKNEIQALRST